MIKGRKRSLTNLQETIKYAIQRGVSPGALGLPLVHIMDWTVQTTRTTALYLFLQNHVAVSSFLHSPNSGYLFNSLSALATSCWYFIHKFILHQSKVAQKTWNHWLLKMSFWNRVLVLSLRRRYGDKSLLPKSKKKLCHTHPNVSCGAVNIKNVLHCSLVRFLEVSQQQICPGFR